MQYFNTQKPNKMNLFTDQMAKQIFIFDKPMINRGINVNVKIKKPDVKNVIRKQSLGIR
jgi:hypothetical protein